MPLIIPSSFLHARWARDIAVFLGSCGVDFRFGPPSDQAILNRGIPRSCEEFCLPLKLFCGHVLALAESKENRVLIPVITGNARGDSFLCHPQQRARDIAVNLELIEPERVVSPAFTYDDSLHLMPEGFIELGAELAVPAPTVESALKSREHFLTSARPPRVGGCGTEETGARTPVIALIGTPPVLTDTLLGGKIRGLLDGLGARSVVPDIAGFSLGDFPKDFRHFTFDAMTRVQAAAAFRDPSTDGVIFLQAFLCGPCCNTPSDIGRDEKTKPFLPLVLDQEHSSAGLQTRIEAFLDIVASSKGGKS